MFNTPTRVGFSVTPRVFHNKYKEKMSAPNNAHYVLTQAHAGLPNSVLTTALPTGLIPDVDLTYDLGTNVLRWKDLYLSGSVTAASYVTGAFTFTIDETGSLSDYFTDARADTWLATKDTDDLTEGAGNLYYTEARVSANADVVANTAASHAEIHTIVSHDTSATGAELDTLTDNSMADTLHRHSELSASDGTPDQALRVNAAGQVGIGVAPEQLFHLSTTYPQIKMSGGQTASFIENWGRGVELLANIYYDGALKRVTAGWLGAHLGIIAQQTATEWALVLRSGSDAATPVFNNLFTILHNGNVGIGTDSPDAKLHIAGLIRIELEELPTSNPGSAGMLWRDGTDLKISLG